MFNLESFHSISPQVSSGHLILQQYVRNLSVLGVIYTVNIFHMFCKARSAVSIPPLENN
jgi:hypothetical protein